MLANINTLINEKLKNLQLQLRARDERIKILETENAVLHLKIAQVQGAAHDAKVEAAHHRLCSDYNAKNESMFRHNVLAVHRLFQALKRDYEELRGYLNQLPELLRVYLCAEEENDGFVNAFHLLTADHSAAYAQLQEQLAEAESSLAEAKRQVLEERTRRRNLHNTLVELRGNIRVYCRVRPMLHSLDSNNDFLGIPGTQSEQIINAIDEENISFKQIVSPGNGSCKTKTFEFERVFGTKDDQESVFSHVAPLLTSLLDGYNVCIMAYGQTGSGKTHTMLGNHSLYSDLSTDHPMQNVPNDGVIPRSAKEILRLIKERESPTESYSLEVSVFEIYNNDIVDLLMPSEQRKVKHAVFSASDGSQEIPSLTTKSISTAEELMTYVLFGLMHRHEDSTKIHAHSSRSHLIVQLNIYRSTSSDEISLTKRVHVNTDTRKGSRSQIPTRRSPSNMNRNSPSSQTGDRPRSRSPSPTSVSNMTVKTKLQLVDLAGSECVGMSGVTGNALRETSNINKSLSALADVLQALAENQTHIPYRNTKLTHVLQDTIGGDSKLLIMLCVSPVQKYCTESLQGLGFGTRARQVARGPAKKRKPAGAGVLLPSLSITDIAFPRQSNPLLRSPSSRR